jgi:hypothetical protein
MRRLVLVVAALVAAAPLVPAHADPYSCTIQAFVADPVGCLPRHVVVP